ENEKLSSTKEMEKSKTHFTTLIYGKVRYSSLQLEKMSSNMMRLHQVVKQWFEFRSKSYMWGCNIWHKSLDFLMVQSMVHKILRNSFQISWILVILTVWKLWRQIQ